MKAAIEKATNDIKDALAKETVKDYDDVQSFLDARDKIIKEHVVKLGYDESHPEHQLWVKYFCKAVLL
jgi:hypothetical protein